MIKKINSIRTRQENILRKEMPLPRPPDLLPRGNQYAISHAPFLKVSICVCTRASPFFLFNGKFFLTYWLCTLFSAQKKNKTKNHHILEIVLYQYMGTLTLLLLSWLFMASHFMAPSQFT